MRLPCLKSILTLRTDRRLENIMLKPLMNRLGSEWIFFDGGTGSVLQSLGLKPGELPETWNLSRPDAIKSLHRSYLEAGSHIFNTNTFGANRLKYPDDLEAIVTAAVRLAQDARREAGREDDAYIALDIGPTGKLLKPMGDLDFEEAVSIFGEVVRIGAEAGADLVLIETMNDSYEAKAAVLAAKENCTLPVIITCVFDAQGKMLTGGTPESMTAMMEGLGVDALGVNCSLGPEQMLPIVQRLTDCASVPVVVNPNAGLPRSKDGQTWYDVDSVTFAGFMKQIAEMGACGLGGCCGTTPEFIRETVKCVSPLPFRKPVKRTETRIASFSRIITIGQGHRPVIIGERINPTGKKRFKEALKAGDIDYVLDQGLQQEDAGADVLDVNVGTPEVDEPKLLCEVVTRLQSVIPLPLELDTSDPKAMEGALRLYNGKALINSVNGKEEVMDAVFPLVRKYGGVVVCLLLDENGIPSDAEGRIAIAKRIIKKAEACGIDKKDLVFDGLCMTVSSDSRGALTTLETLRRLRDELHASSILGVSNISFGLPARELINAYFFTMALQSGLSCAIINPNNKTMMQAYRSFLALTDQDENFQGFINAYQDYQTPDKAVEKAVAAVKTRILDAMGISQDQVLKPSGPVGNKADTRIPAKASPESGAASASGSGPLMDLIRRGMSGPAKEATRDALLTRTAVDIIDRDLVPALDIVGKGFEKGQVFLPQLLMAAEAAKEAFAVLKEAMTGETQAVKGRVILATVKGDIHDIGKNIVKVLLENYGYTVLDLGKDVSPETIVDTAVNENIRLVGLSALMTTTVVNMEETIKQLREKKPDCRIAVGGAVMTQEYADQIGADFYGKDAMATVRYADSLAEQKLL